MQAAVTSYCTSDGIEETVRDIGTIDNISLQVRKLVPEPPLSPGPVLRYQWNGRHYLEKEVSLAASASSQEWKEYGTANIPQ